MTPQENVGSADEIRTGVRDDNATLGLDVSERHRPVIESWAGLVKLGDENNTAYGDMIARLRDFLNHVAAARMDSDTVVTLRDELERWRQHLAPMAVTECDQMFGHLRDLQGRGQTMSPTFVVTEADCNNVWGTVRFGRYFLGGNGAVHGGAIPLFFDEVLGRLANSEGRPHARTAYLHTDYRSVTPVGVELTVHGWFVREEGRKRVLRAELRSGDVVCAEAEGLFVRLNPGQP